MCADCELLKSCDRETETESETASPVTFSLIDSYLSGPGARVASRGQLSIPGSRTGARVTRSSGGSRFPQDDAASLAPGVQGSATAVAAAADAGDREEGGKEGGWSNDGKRLQLQPRRPLGQPVRQEAAQLAIPPGIPRPQVSSVHQTVVVPTALPGISESQSQSQSQWQQDRQGGTHRLRARESVAMPVI